MKTFNSQITSGICCALFALGILAPTLSHSATARKAGPSPKGKALFSSNCATCHGSTGQGGEGPNLHGLKLSDAKISSTITQGIKGEMPAFNAKLKGPEVKAIVAYLRTLKK